MIGSSADLSYRLITLYGPRRMSATTFRMKVPLVFLRAMLAVLNYVIPFRITDPPKDAPLFSPTAGWNIRRTIRVGRRVRRTADGTTYSEK